MLPEYKEKELIKNGIMYTKRDLQVYKEQKGLHDQCECCEWAKDSIKGYNRTFKRLAFKYSPEEYKNSMQMCEDVEIDGFKEVKGKNVRKQKSEPEPDNVCYEVHDLDKFKNIKPVSMIPWYRDITKKADEEKDAMDKLIKSKYGL